MTRTVKRAFTFRFYSTARQAADLARTFGDGEDVKRTAPRRSAGGRR
ncbi:helix-turn-helix domain-containing protein [Micromonospora echinofusca]